MRDLIRTFFVAGLLTACGTPSGPDPAPASPRPKLTKVHDLSSELTRDLPGLFRKMKALPVVGVSAQPGLAERLATWGLPRDEYNNRDFDSADARFVWSRRLLYERATALTGAIPEAADKIRVVTEWIHLFAHHTAGGDMVENVGMMPETVLWRGYGHPNRLSFALWAVLRQAGFKGLLVARPDADLPDVVAIHAGGKWVFADPVAGRLIDDPGGDFWFAFDPRAVTPRMRGRSPALERKWPARYAMDFLALEKELSARVPAGRRVKVFSAPVRWIRQWRDEKHRSTLLVMTRGLSGRSEEGRAALVAGQIARARLAYTDLERPDTLTMFYLAQCAYENQDDVEARRLFTTCLERKAIGRLHGVCRLYLRRLSGDSSE